MGVEARPAPCSDLEQVFHDLGKCLVSAAEAWNCIIWIIGLPLTVAKEKNMYFQSNFSNPDIVVKVDRFVFGIGFEEIKPNFWVRKCHQ